jgi:tRNA-2-methylthio-N6-dimethylallyladenosine synthase
MDLLIPDKTHDEGRQGEALVLEPVAGKNNGRKLYIESYGCAMNFSDRIPAPYAKMPSSAYVTA